MYYKVARVSILVYSLRNIFYFAKSVWLLKNFVIVVKGVMWAPYGVLNISVTNNWHLNK